MEVSAPVPILIFSQFAAHRQRPHPRQQEAVRVPVEGVQQEGEAVQGAVHACGAHAETHRGEATQVHGKGPAPGMQECNPGYSDNPLMED